MRRVSLLPRFLALFVSAYLALPTPGHALRTMNAGMEESPVHQELHTRFGISAAGLEQKGRIFDLLADEKGMHEPPHLPRTHTVKIIRNRIQRVRKEEDWDAIISEGAREIHMTDVGFMEGEALAPFFTTCSPCTFMIVYDRDSHETYYAHSFGFGLDNLEKSLSVAIERFANRRNRIVFFIGGGDLAEDEVSPGFQAWTVKMLSDRSALMERAKAAGFKIVQAIPDFVGITISTFFDPRQGLLSVEESRSDDYRGPAIKVDRFLERIGINGVGLEELRAVIDEGRVPFIAKDERLGTVFYVPEVLEFLEKLGQDPEAVSYRIAEQIAQLDHRAFGGSVTDRRIQGWQADLKRKLVYILIDPGARVTGFRSGFMDSLGNALMEKIATHQDDDVRGRGFFLMDATLRDLKSRGALKAQWTARDYYASNFFRSYFSKRGISAYRAIVGEGGIQVNFELDLKKADLESREVGLEEVVKAWENVAVTPAYAGVQKPFLPLLFPGAVKAAPLVVEAGLEFVLLVDSDAGLEEAKLLLERVGADPQRYRIFRVKGTDFSAAISEAKREFPDRPIYLVNPAQPDWLRALLGGLEEIGILPIGGLEEAFQATQRYLERAA